MARRVLLHVGAPKTGTSFVQDILFTNAAALRDQGILYPADRFDQHFLAALDLMQLTWGGLEREAVGAWDALAAEVRAWPGTAIVSHEIFGRASRLQVARAFESLGEGVEVHVVLSARDLVRQIPAEWQENVKHRRTKRYADFLADLRDPARPSEISQWFWGVQEVPDVLDRWGATLPPERVHVVTVPKPGAPHELLWERFCGVFGLDATAFAPASRRTNSSLGVAESALVRRLNERLNDVLPNADYRAIVREALVHQNLAATRGSARLSVPDDVWAWADELSQAWVGELQARGYAVVGDLAELLPDPPLPYVDPDHPDVAELAEAGINGIVALVEEAARLRRVEDGLHADVADLMRQLDAAHSTPIYRAKERLVRMADSSSAARFGLAAYRRARGSSSRST